MELLTKHDANNINKSNTFSIDTVSMKINRQSQIQFKGQDLWSEYTLSTR